MKSSSLSGRVVTGVALIALLSAWGGNRLSGHRTLHVGNRSVPAKPVNGGTLTIGITEDPDTLNPLTTQLVSSGSILSGIMEGLLSSNSKGGTVYKLATSYSVSKNGLIYTWHLRHGVKFQDGEPFDAKVVVDNWKALTNPKFGAFANEGWTDITRINTPNKYTVVMHTLHSYAPFVFRVGRTVLSPPRAFQSPQYDQQTFGQHPVGTGPYTFVKWLTGQYVELGRNPQYWGAKAHIQTIFFKIVPNANTLMVELKARGVQMTPLLPSIRYSEARSLPDTVVITKPGLTWYHLDLKNIGFLRDRKVRLALAYATPVREIITRLLHGLALPCPTDNPPGEKYHNPHVTLYPYNPSKSKQLLKADGFKMGSNGVLEKNGAALSVQYWIPSGDQESSEIQQVVTAAWRQIGVGVTDDEQDPNSLYGPSGYQFTRAMTVSGYSWNNLNDPADEFYWNSKDIPKTPTGNGGDDIEYFYKYPWQAKIDKLTTAGVTTVDPRQREKIFWKIQSLLHAEEPVVFMYAEKEIFVAPRNLIGFNPSAYSALLWNAADWQLTK